MTDGQKAQAAAKALQAFADAQPTRNDPWVWASEAVNFPTVALAMLYDAFKGGEA